MKNIRNKKLFPFMILALVLCCLLALGGCAEEKVEDIAFSDTNKPRTTYVQGQDLDLSVGMLTAIVDGEAKSVPLNAEGVSITGYDKNQIGKQTLTVSYKDKTATLEITVVARITVEEYKLNYFVGDSFDATKGKVKLANDNGTFSNLSFNSVGVTVTGFDTSAAGTVNVGIAYEANGARYESTFPIVVHSIGELTFTKPSKTIYQSHETEIDLTGGYFTATASDDASFSDYVNITPDMVSGFDPSVATRDNREEPLKQTVTVSYAGKTFEFQITIVYGAIAVIRENAKLLEGLDLSGDFVLTKEQGDAAFEAAYEYFNMTKAEKGQIDEQMLKTIMISAAVCVSERFQEAAKPYSQSFTLSPAGNLLFQGESYEQMNIDRAKLMDPDEMFNVYAEVLRGIKEDFADLEIRENETLGNYIKVPPAEEIEFYIGMFLFLMELHENMMVIPEDWKVEDLRFYANNIDTAVYLIQVNNMIGPTFSYVFEALANWRTNNDYFDIIYSYYYYVAEDGHVMINEVLWQRLPLPGVMQKWYLAFYNAVLEAQFMGQYGDGDAYLRDTSAFMHYYWEAIAYAEQIKNGDNQLYKELYEMIMGDVFMDKNIVSSAGGYVAHSNGLTDSEAYMDLWEKYLAVYRLYLSGQYDFVKHQAESQAMLDALSRLSVVELYEFLCSLQNNYIETTGSYHAFDYSNKASNSFVAVLANYCLSNLSENGRGVVQQLLLAMENYAFYCGAANAENLESFKQGMQELTASVEALSQEDKAAFDRLLGKCYQQYLRYYEVEESQKEIVVDQGVQEKLDQLLHALDTYYAVYKHMSAEGTTQNEIRFSCIQLFASYEKAKQIYNELMQLDNMDVKTLLSTKIYTIGEVAQTLDMGFNVTRNQFVYWMFVGLRMDIRDEEGEVIATAPCWHYYRNTGAAVFVQKAADMLMAGFHGTLKDLDKAYVDSVSEALRQLDEDDFIVLYAIGIPRYMDCIATYLTEKLSGEGMDDLAIAVLDAQFGYIVYHALGHRDVEKDYFKTQFEEAKALYEQLQDTTEFDQYLKDMYEFYLNFYNSL